MCTGKIDIGTTVYFTDKIQAKLCGVSCLILFIYFIFKISVAQISAEEIKDTRVVCLEIEAQNLDKKVLIFLKTISRASTIFRVNGFWAGTSLFLQTVD